MMFEGKILLVDDQPVAAQDSIAALEHFCKAVPDPLCRGRQGGQADSGYGAGPAGLSGYRNAWRGRLFPGGLH